MGRAVPVILFILGTASVAAWLIQSRSTAPPAPTPPPPRPAYITHNQASIDAARAEIAKIQAARAAGTAASAPSTRPSAWRYSTDVDPMTSSATRWARVVSDNMEQFRFPYHGGARGEIILRRHPRYGQDVIFQLERGQIICHRECSVLVRFDDRAPYRVTGVEAADNDPTVLFLRGFRRLTTDMARASIMRVSITVHHEGDRVFTFPVSGLDLRRK